ncbi:ABC-type transport auxiliary lipoprotein family protein [Prosthecomicrobium sp. N25]|uniref:ABC-type transport auxiliary lipoprotein family protein n=1 Tax=Prosthecomicrobium sp. N25 TaxID=3129254 RepID=UPI00307711AB
METDARYGIIGAFTLAVIGAAFLFVFWMHTTGGLGEQSVYQIRFAGSVSGLRPGSSVLFNGIRVGEVLDLSLVPEDSSRVQATVSVNRGTPIHTDTQIAVETQGLMGSPSILLSGGTGPLAVGQAGRPPLLDADPNATETLTRSAGSALKKLDLILAENAEPLNNAIVKFGTFAEALARNSERLDNIAAGLERMVGSSAKKPPVVYDLTAPASFDPPVKAPAGKVTVAEPTALVVFDTQKVLVSPQAGERTPLEEGQWSDSIPKMLQAKVIQSFENAGQIDSVSRPSDLGSAEVQLSLDIRNFQVSQPDKTALVEFAARLLDSDGKIKAARLFKQTAPVAGADSASAARALDAAFGKAATELVRWTSEAE